MTKHRAMPGMPLTEAERRALAPFGDGAYRNAATVAAALGIVGLGAGNIGVRVRRLYEKGCLSFRWPEGDYCITPIGRQLLAQEARTAETLLSGDAP